MGNKMENKILRLTTSSLFALQGAFAIFWSLYMYLEDNLRLTEAFVIGCILLLFALLFNFRKPIIKKTAYAVLVLYTIFFDICGTMLIGVASPVIWIAWVMIFLIVSNSALILYYCYLFETPYRDKNVVNSKQKSWRQNFPNPKNDKQYVVFSGGGGPGLFHVVGER